MNPKKIVKDMMSHSFEIEDLTKCPQCKKELGRSGFCGKKCYDKYLYETTVKMRN